MPAVRCRKNVLDEKIVDTVANVAIREREVQRPLYLPTELLSLPFGLPVRRRLARLASYRASANSGSINCDPLRSRLCCLKIFPIYTHTDPLGTERAPRTIHGFWLRRWAQARRTADLTQAAPSRLNGIARCAIGDMVISPSVTRFRIIGVLFRASAPSQPL